MKILSNSRISTRILLTGMLIFGIASCGESEASTPDTALPADGTATPRTFCETATEASKVELGTGDGKSDAIKLFYANQVVAAESLAGVAPSEIKEVAENLRVSTVELFKLIEKFKFDLGKVEADAGALKQIDALNTKYSLEASDAAMKKYLLDKCGISDQQQGATTTVAQ